MAVDRLGNQNPTTRIVTVTPADPANPVPAPVLVTPLAGRQFVAGTVLTLVVSAANPDGSLPDHVDFYADDVLIAPSPPTAPASPP